MNKSMIEETFGEIVGDFLRYFLYNVGNENVRDRYE